MTVSTDIGKCYLRRFSNLESCRFALSFEKYSHPGPQEPCRVGIFLSGSLVHSSEAPLSTCRLRVWRVASRTDHASGLRGEAIGGLESRSDRGLVETNTYKENRTRTTTLAGVKKKARSFIMISSCKCCATHNLNSNTTCDGKLQTG